MKCPKCHRSMVKTGKDRKNQQRWKCQSCKLTKTEIAKTIKISDRVIQEIKSLPQIESGEWTVDFLIEQVLKNYLKLDSDYNTFDLALIINNKIIE